MYLLRGPAEGGGRRLTLGSAKDPRVTSAGRIGDGGPESSSRPQAPQRSRSARSRSPNRRGRKNKPRQDSHRKGTRERTLGSQGDRRLDLRTYRLSHRVQPQSSARRPRTMSRRNSMGLPCEVIAPARDISVMKTALRPRRPRSTPSGGLIPHVLFMELTPATPDLFFGSLGFPPLRAGKQGTNEPPRSA